MTEDEFYINSPADARTCINQTVYWDDIGARYVFLRSGVIEEVKGRNIKIDGDWKLLGNLTNVRNFKDGGAWGRLSP